MSVCTSSGETLVNVLDCKKDMGLWHGVLTVSLDAHRSNNALTSMSAVVSVTSMSVLVSVVVLD